METQEFYIPYDELQKDRRREVIYISDTYLFVKRFFDIILSLFGILALSPLLIVLSVIIKVTSPGPVIFRHKRVGYHGREIGIFKFRSMVTDADNFEKYFTPEQMELFKTNFKLDDDPRITKIGKFLRKTSLDELPQLFNIFCGQMSIVGPRPIVTDELAKYGIYKNLFLSVKPGLTGLWQVCGRSTTTYEQRVLLDAKYVKHLSILTDFKIMFRTVGVVFTREGAC